MNIKTWVNEKRVLYMKQENEKRVLRKPTFTPTINFSIRIYLEVFESDDQPNYNP